MAGLLPDASVGNANDWGGERAAPMDGDIAPAPDAQDMVPAPSATVIKIHGDKIEIIDGAQPAPETKQSDRFDQNLAEVLDDSALSQIGQDLKEGVEADIRARKEFIDNYNKGLDFLGIKMQGAGAVRGRRSTTKVFHPVLQWACSKFQASTRGELLPAAGPVKVMNFSDESPDGDELSQDLEQDMNWYLTAGAPEYYPDFDRGLYYLGYGGTLYKKIYRCPIRQRPVSDCVYLTELIVSPEATSLPTALRITHDIGDMSNNEVRRLMAEGIYREVELAPPTGDDNETRRKEREISGKRESQERPQDMPRRLFETYAFLDLSQHGIKEAGQPKSSGGSVSTADSPRIPLPYKITLDKDLGTVLEIRRNWKKGDRLFRRNRVFVEYGMVPGMGTLNYGYLHLLGNIAQALTALTRMTIDAGMFSNFPGGVRLRGARADTNEINPAPGEWANLDVPVDDIRKAMMPMPYKGPDQTIMALISYLEGAAQKLVGAVEMNAGEGKTHIPVGTMMAMIEQQTVMMAAVHKRLHNSQKDELMALRDLFAEYPEDLVKLGNKSGRLWSPAMFENLALVPCSDPNVPSQVHRIMQATAVAMLAAQQPGVYDQLAVNKWVLQAIGIGHPENLFSKTPPGSQPPAPDPKLLAVAAKQKADQQNAQSQQQKVMAEGALRVHELEMEAADRQQDRESRERVANIKLRGEQMKIAAADQQHNGEGLVPPVMRAHGGAVPHLDLGQRHAGLTSAAEQKIAAADPEPQVSPAIERLKAVNERLAASTKRISKRKRLTRDQIGRAQSLDGKEED